MPVTELFIIGKTTVPSSWVAFIIAFVVAYSAIRIRYGKNIAEILVDATFYFIIVWKFSVILTDFGSVIKSPLSIIYFHGGAVGFYLGILAAAVRILLELKRKGLGRMDRLALFVGFVTIQSVYQVMMVFLNEGTLSARVITVVSFTLLALFVWIFVGKEKSSPAQLVYLLMAVNFFVAVFQPSGIIGASALLATVLIGLFFLVLVFKGPVMELNTESEGLT